MQANFTEPREKCESKKIELYLAELGVAYGSTGHKAHTVLRKLVNIISEKECNCGNKECCICMCKQIVKERGRI